MILDKSCQDLPKKYFFFVKNIYLMILPATSECIVSVHFCGIKKKNYIICMRFKGIQGAVGMLE
jgi:hypothetical protein